MQSFLCIFYNNLQCQEYEYCKSLSLSDDNKQARRILIEVPDYIIHDGLHWLYTQKFKDMSEYNYNMQLVILKVLVQFLLELHHD